MRALIFIALIPLFLSAQNRCDSIFYGLDPVNMSIGTQALIIAELNDCLSSEFPLNDSLTIYDRYYKGVVNDLGTQVSDVFNQPFDKYEAENIDLSRLSSLNLTASTLSPQPFFTLNTSQNSSLQGDGQSPHIKGQYYRLLGDLSDQLFEGLYDEMPNNISHEILQAGAYKLAWFETQGQNVFYDAQGRPDSINFLSKNLHRPIGKALGITSFPYTRLTMQYMIEHQEELKSRVSTQDLITHAQTSLVNKDLIHANRSDSLLNNANTLYKNYRDSVVNQFAQDWSTIMLNTELNLNRLELIQGYYNNISLQMDSLASASVNNPDSVQIRYDHFNLLNQAMTGRNFVDDYLSGSLNIGQFINDLRADATVDLAILNAAENIRDTEDLSDIVNIENTFSKVKNGFENGNPSLIAGTAITGVAAAGAAFGVRKILKESGGLKNLFTDEKNKKKRNKLLKGGVKGLAKIGSGLIVGYVAKEILGDILSQQVVGPIMANIDALRQEMNARFDVIDKKLDNIINIQIQTAELVLDGLKYNREVMQYEFNNVNIQLDQIVDNQNQMSSQLQNILSTELNLCPGAAEDITSIIPFQNYTDLHQATGEASGVIPCVRALRSALDGTLENSACADLTKFIVTPNSPYANHELDNYEKVSTLFEFIYAVDIEQQSQQLLIKIDELHELEWLKTYMNNENLDFGISASAVLSKAKYIDISRLAQIISYYDIFQPYLEVFTESDDFTPLKLDDYLAKSLSDRTIRISSNKRHIDNLLCVVNIAIAQQALMSGHSLMTDMYETVYRNRYNGQTIMFQTESIPVKQFIVDILATNPVLASNFASYTLTRNFRSEEDYSQKKWQSSKDAIINGTFERGSTGFSASNSITARYNSTASITTTNDPGTWCNSCTSFGDHTSGSGLMLVASHGNELETIWTQDIMLAGGRTYILNFAYTAALDAALNDEDQQISLEINGVEKGLYNLGLNAGTWRVGSFQFTADHSKVYTISFKFETGSPFYATAMDDISLITTYPSVFNFENNSTPINLGMDILYSYGYDHTGGVAYPVQTDTVIFLENTVDIDISQLGKANGYQNLTLFKTDIGANEITVLEVLADPGCSISVGGIRCEAMIPFPPFQSIQESGFQYTEAYQVMDAQRQKTYDLHASIHLPDHYKEDWLSKQLYKVILLEDAK